ncbi:hypothetical protein ABFS82_11G099000 [Erythranthe guttata]|nr:PREDICTED: thaumatin-like protein [Erythranthe guttata]|eukprot:XP_012839029.1 PREDICTED: thaumatin-like protein [Erythranthe guttata]
MALYLFILIILLTTPPSTSTPTTVLTLYNMCDNDIWPAFQGRPEDSVPRNGGFQLSAGHAVYIKMPPQWAGRIWARTGCIFDRKGNTTGNCLTGDCAGGSLECAGRGGQPPMTLAEFTFGVGPMDIYGISIVDGFNIPMVIWPGGVAFEHPVKGNCSVPDCADVNKRCPEELQIKGSQGEIVACRSACNAFHTDEYCCVGAYSSPGACKPTNYSRIFKDACPDARSYAFDDASHTDCQRGVSYTVRFC